MSKEEEHTEAINELVETIQSILQGSMAQSGRIDIMRLRIGRLEDRIKQLEGRK